MIAGQHHAAGNPHLTHHSDAHHSTWDVTSETPFALFSEHSTTHDSKDMGDEFDGKQSTHNAAGYFDIPLTKSPGPATQEELENVSWDYLLTANTHHSVDYGDISSGHPPPTSYSQFNANEVQD